MGLTRLELVTSRLSGVRSNQLSYRPICLRVGSLKTKQYLPMTTYTFHRIFSVVCLLRKEVIQPHLPIRLPCYDFTPVTFPTLDGCAGFGCE